MAMLTACSPELLFEGFGEPHPIIILDLDTLRADHLGCYFYSRDTSPNIDALSAESFHFERAFSQAPYTAPSQTSILTSLYPTQHGVITRRTGVPDAVFTLAEVLRDYGYETAAFVDGGFMSATFGMNQGFALYDDEAGGLEKIGPKAIDWLRAHTDEDFFLLIHTYDIHTPYDPPEPYRSLFLAGLEPPTEGFEPTSQVMEEIRRSGTTDNPLTLPPNDLEYARALYDGGIRYVDDWIGSFLEEVEDLGLDQRATIVLISDHGEEFQEHGSVLHEKLYTTVTRIPLMVRVPGAERAATVRTIVETIDLMPTLLAMTGAPPPPMIAGESMVPIMLGEDDGSGTAYGESAFFGGRRYMAEGDYQLLYSIEDESIELYDYVRDPYEQADLLYEATAMAVRMRSSLRGWLHMLASTPSPLNPTIVLDPEAERQLKALGYIR
jgi:arylsulfatase A-like enzyme